MEVLIKNIPLNWKPDHMLQFIHQRKLPSPRALNYLYDGSHVFRGLAFATFASSKEAWGVVLGLNCILVCGKRLRVQLKRKRPELTAREQVSQRSPFQSNFNSDTDAPAKAYLHSRAKVSSATRPTREQTPPSDSYYLLMRYQTDPVEKEKLKRFLVRTGDYQAAVNEFAKNRAREIQAGQHGWGMEDGVIMERRSPTPGEQMQIDEMESGFELGDGASSSGSLILNHQGEQDVTPKTRDISITRTNLASVNEKMDHTHAQSSGYPEEGKKKRALWSAEQTQGSGN